jgi:two-component system, cell cycle sensor histidine kinase and response regulator CckA
MRADPPPLRNEPQAAIQGFAPLLNVIDLPVMVTDTAGAITFWNLAAEAYFGWSPWEAIGRLPRELVLPAEFHAHAQAIKTQVQHGEHWRGELQVQRRDGTVFPAWAMVSPIHNEAGELVGMVAVTDDLTAEKRAIATLHETEERSRRMIQVAREHAEAVRELLQTAERIAHVGHWVWYPPTDIGIWSDEMYRIFGLEPRAVPITRSLALQWIHPDDRPRLEQAVRTGLERGEPYQYEARAVAPDGHERVISVHGTPQLDAQGTVVRVVGTAQDITERKLAEAEIQAERERARALEAQLQQASRLEAIGEVAGAVAHDFRNMLAVMLGHTELLLEGEHVPTALRSQLQEIRAAGQRANRLSEQLLAFGRRQALAPSEVELNRVVTEMVELLQPVLGRGIQVHTRLAPRLGVVRVDQGQLEQAIVNLAVNARDAMPEGGTLTLETREVELSSGVMPPLAPGRYVQLSVADTGIGMDPDTQQRVFEPYFTTKAPGQGTGLGLSTVFGFVTQSGGHISVTSTPGAGSVFVLYLPLDYQPGNPTPVK